MTRLNTTGDYDIAEVLEHLMHTIHLYGVPGAVTGSGAVPFSGIQNTTVIGKQANSTTP